MKKFLIVAAAIMVCAGCGGEKRSLKVEDPAQRAAMRTRDSSCPIDSVFTSAGLRATFDIAGQIKPKALLSDFKEARAVASESEEPASMKDVYATVKKEHSGEYSPGLTIYFTVMAMAFVILMLIKVALAIFKND